MFNSHKKFELSPRLRLGVGRGYSQNQILKISGILCLVLALGLATNAVRLMFAGSSQNEAGTPQVLGATDTKIQSSTAEVQFIEYKIQKGDTLFNVAQKYNISWTTLATLNNLKSPFTLKPGDTLKIPK